MNDLTQLLALAHELADASGAAIRPWFRTRLDADDKAQTGDPGFRAYSPVTIADRSGEEAIRALLDARVPTHGVLGEELGEKAGDDWRWVLDPVDGTRGFITGLLSWGTLIGLEYQGEPVLGVVDQPVTGERFWGTAEGAFFRWRGETQRLQTRATTRLEDAVLCCTHPNMFQGEDLTRFEALASRVKMVRYGTDCMGYTMVAAGHADLVVEASLQSYDVVAHVPILGAAGGLLTDWSGQSATGGGRAIAAANATLHAQVLDILG